MPGSSSRERPEPAAPRHGTIAAAAAALAVLGSGTAGAQPLPAAAAHAACTVVGATLDGELDSARARVGDRFRFTVDGTAPQQAGAHGIGLVAAVEGAKRGGSPGRLAIEPRFVESADGTHVPVILVAIAARRSAISEGNTRDAPFVLSVAGVFRPTPYQVIAGLTGAYNFLHFGGQAVLAPGTRLQLALGDDYLSGSCDLPPAPAAKTIRADR